MTPVEMHLKSFGNCLEFMPKSFSSDAGVSFGFNNFSPKGFSSSTDDLLNLSQGFLIHNPFL